MRGGRTAFPGAGHAAYVACFGRSSPAQISRLGEHPSRTSIAVREPRSDVGDDARRVRATLRGVTSVGASDPGKSQGELLFRAITEAADNASIGVVVLHLAPEPVATDDVTIVHVNRAMESLLGFGRQEIVERGFWSFIPQRERALI